MKTLVFVGLLALLTGMRPVGTFTAPPPMTNPCKTQDGKDRPFPCEFAIQTIFFMGKNNEVLAKSTANGQSIKLPMSKAVSSQIVTQGGLLVYNVSVDFTRISKASFPTPAYTLSEAKITSPISPGETSVINKAISVGPNLPKPGLRPNRLLFKLQLNYATGGGQQPTLNAPIQMILLENPATYAKLAKLQQFRDRAEAWRTMQMSVDFKQ